MIHPPGPRSRTGPQISPGAPPHHGIVGGQLVTLPAVSDEHKPNHTLSGLLRGYQSFGYTPGPLLAFALIVGIIGAFGLPRGARRRRGEAWLFAMAGILVLVVPAATVMFDYRYLVPDLVLLPPAGALGVTVVLIRVRARRQAERTELHEPTMETT